MCLSNFGRAWRGWARLGMARRSKTRQGQFVVDRLRSIRCELQNISGRANFNFVGQRKAKVPNLVVRIPA